MNLLCSSLIRFWKSAIGKKLVMAVTGLILLGFLLGHMTGNLLIFQGRSGINGYAEFLHTVMHGWGLWFARGILFVAFVLHIVTAVQLTRKNREAKQVRYACDATMQVSRGARMMIWSGLAILAFVVIHLMHFTIRINPELANMADPTDPDRHDVFGMVIKGFHNPVAVLIYVLAITILCSHLAHGIASALQTLGLLSYKTRHAAKRLGLAISILLWVGFLSVPLLIATGVIQDVGAAQVISSAAPAVPPAP